jgi:hypothetical protein
MKLKFNLIKLFCVFENYKKIYFTENFLIIFFGSDFVNHVLFYFILKDVN